MLLTKSNSVEIPVKEGFLSVLREFSQKQKSAYKHNAFYYKTALKFYYLAKRSRLRSQGGYLGIIWKGFVRRAQSKVSISYVSNIVTECNVNNSQKL